MYKRPVLKKKHAGYALASAAIADILASLFAPNYTGLFSVFADILTSTPQQPVGE